MRILIINFEYPPLGGGGGVATKNLAEELTRRHEVHVVTTHFPGLPRQETNRRVRIHRVRVLGRTSLPTASLISLVTFVPTALYRIWRLCRTTRFDVINAQFVLPSGLPAAIVAWGLNLPLVVSFIGGDVYDPTKGVSPHRYALLRQLVRLIANSAQAATAISEDTRRRAQSLHGVRIPITVIPLGRVPVPVPSVTRPALGLPDGLSIYVSIGRLIPRKGFAKLLEAWTNVPQAHLVIIGSGPLNDQLHSLRIKYGLTDRVHLWGYVDETRKLQALNVATGYISAAAHEGFGIVFLEAMAAGLPIVATNDGGQLDFLEPQVNALLVPPDDPAALAGAVNRLEADHALQAILRRHNLDKVGQYTMAKTTAQFERVLQQAVAGHNARSHENRH